MILHVRVTQQVSLCAQMRKTRDTWLSPTGVSEQKQQQQQLTLVLSSLAMRLPCLPDVAGLNLAACCAAMHC